MKARVWHGKRDMRVGQVPECEARAPTDAVARITAASCGSDPDQCGVLAPFMESVDVLGQEPMGVVEGFRLDLQG